MLVTTSDFKDYTVSKDGARALSGFNGGYYVTLHCDPKRRRFIVDATSADDAHKMALAVWSKEKGSPRLTGATIVHRGGNES